MNFYSYTISSVITFDVEYSDDNGKLFWHISVAWPEVHKTLNLDPDEDEYDGTRDDELCQMLLACGAPSWVRNPIESYNDHAAWVIWGEAKSDDQLVSWALFNPEIAGPTDDFEALRERSIDWEISRVA